MNTPAFEDVIAAAKRIGGHIHKTPVLTSRMIDEQFGAKIFFKCENFQRMGAFKFRGAMNAVARLASERQHLGVVAFSSGNHAQAVALASRILGIPATIVMPHDAPLAKMEATRGYGGRVIVYDRYTEDREAIARDLAERESLALIPPFDHPDVIAGQGTATLEFIDEVGELDALFVCLGGGGLLSGAILATRERTPRTAIYGVEPLAGNDGQRSLREGSIVRIETPVTIADGAQTQQLGKITFEIIRRGVTDILAVEDTALVDAMRLLAERMKMVVEPTGCLGLAGATSMRDLLANKRIGVLISGGNVDMERFGSLIAERAQALKT